MPKSISIGGTALLTRTAIVKGLECLYDNGINKKKLPHVVTRLCQNLINENISQLLHWTDGQTFKLEDDEPLFCEFSDGSPMMSVYILDRPIVEKSLNWLEKNGVEKDECPNVLQAFCYSVLDVEIEDFLIPADYE